MNTMGKLLVIVNLLFAVATGAFLAVDFATRTQWRDAYEKREDEHVTVRANNEELTEAQRRLVAEVKQAREDLHESEFQHKGRLVQMELTLKKKNEEIDGLKKNVEIATLNQQKSLDEALRLGVEIKELNGHLKKRQEEIAELQDASRININRAIEADSNAKKHNERALTLLSQLQTATRRLAELENKLAGGDKVVNISPQVRDRNFVNPPRVNVKGQINRVLPEDPTLVQITLGSDAGLETDNTLEVFRLSPQPEYLGRLRLVDVHSNYAIGRVVRPSGMLNADAPRAGDNVATKIMP